MAARYAKGSPEAALEAHISGLPDEFLECQVTQRHRLPMVTDYQNTRFKRQKNGTYQQIAYCVYCGTKVTKVVAASGYLDDLVGHPDYDHPKDYLRPAAAKAVSAKDANAMRRREARLRNQQAEREARKLAAKAAATLKSVS
jgi:hypothetical protein